MELSAVAVGDDETTALPLVFLTAFGDRLPDELAQQALEGIARFGMLGRRGGDRAAVSPNHVAPSFLGDFGRAAELVEEVARRNRPFPNGSLAGNVARHQPPSHLSQNRIEFLARHSVRQDM